jgi:hypothetical protein
MTNQKARNEMKHKATLLLIAIFTLFLVSCIEIEVSDVQRIELIDFNPPGVINVGDDPISLAAAKLNVYIQGETEPETFVLSNQDVVLSGTGYDSSNNTLKTSDEGIYKLKVSYGGVSVTLTYKVYGTDVLGVGPYDKYTDLQAAITAAGSGDTIHLSADYQTSVSYVVEDDDEITLDLAGHSLFAYTESTTSFAVIVNNGSLTIKDTSDNQAGKITTHATNPDTRPMPGYASNTITNQGTLVVDSGTIENTSDGYATYPIDNISTSRSASVTINGGTITNPMMCEAIRLNARSATNENTVTINGGEISGGGGGSGWGIIWVQADSTLVANHAELIITGGVFQPNVVDTESLRFFPSSGATIYNYTNIHLTISGGTFSTDIVYINNETYGMPLGNMNVHEDYSSFLIGQSKS